MGAVLALVLLAGCNPERSVQRPDSSPRLTVLTTFVPITLFTRAVAGDCAEVRALIPPQLGPHDFQARPSDLAALRRARVLVKNGLGIEAFLEPLLTGTDRSNLRVIDSSVGVRTIATSPMETDQSDGDGHAPGSHTTEADHDRSRQHDASGAGHRRTTHRHGPSNPHIWLDPVRASQQVETIRDGLIAADPACAADYRRNAARTVAALQRLDRDIARELAPYRGRTFVALHDFAPYIAERYGLRAAFLVDVPEAGPTPVDLQRVSQIVRRNRLRALLSEPRGNDRSLQALAQDLGIAVRRFDGLETSTAAVATSASAGNPGAYVTLMRTNAAQLRQVFGG